jgi:hypothetical protein
VDLTLYPMPGAGATALSAWQVHMQCFQRPQSDLVLNLEASSVDLGARALMYLGSCRSSTWLETEGGPR